MKKSILIPLILIIFIIGVFTVGYTQKPKAGKTGPGKMWCSQIPDLTEEQQAKIDELHLNFQKEMAPKRIQAQKLELELKELMIADKPDQKKIDSKVEAIGKHRIEMRKAGVKHELAVRELLTEEQRVVFMNCGFGGGFGPEFHEPGFRGGRFGGRRGPGMQMRGPVMAPPDVEEEN